MENSTIYYAVIIVSFVGLAAGCALAIWRVFRYRERLYAFIINNRWERTLSRNRMYNDDLITFFGDSQIGLWRMAPSFGALPIVNKGVYGDFALKARERFDKDVLSLNPKMVVMLIGTNDLGDGQSPESIKDAIQVMAEKAANRNIKLILCSLLPVRGKYLRDRDPKDIVQINNMLQLLSTQYDADYVDFHSQLVDCDGLFKSEFTSDGLHSSGAGYMVMTKTIFPYLIKHSVSCIGYSKVRELP